MKKTISTVLLGLGLVSASAYAGHMPEPMPVSNDINVTAPVQPAMWTFGATALLLQPTNKEFDYADSIDGPTSVNQGPIGDELTHHRVDEDYDWWFGADITYSFPDSSRDLTLAYEGLQSTDSDSTSSTQLGNLHSSFSGQSYLTAEGETNIHYDAVDLLLGQKIDVGSRVRFHPFGGLRYAYINTNDEGEYTGGQNDIGGASARISVRQDESSNLKNMFNGVGPRFGSDAEVKLGEGFSLRGRLGLSALIGTHDLDNKVNIIVYNPNGTVNTAQTGTVTIADDSETRVIPEIDGRLGLHYGYDFNASTSLGLELGWQAINYFNVISDQPSLTALVGNGGNNNNNNNGLPSTHYAETSNFGLQGPYARVDLNIA